MTRNQLIMGITICLVGIGTTLSIVSTVSHKCSDYTHKMCDSECSCDGFECELTVCGTTNLKLGQDLTVIDITELDEKTIIKLK